jgi:type 2 lantibiotic biosynthesis protein LanM
MRPKALTCAATVDKCDSKAGLNLHVRMNVQDIRSLNFNERNALLGAPSSETGLDLERSTARIQRWRARAAFATDPEYFSARLKSEGISEHGLPHLVGDGERGGSLNGGPDYLGRVYQIIESFGGVWNTPTEQGFSRDRIILPFLHHAKGELAKVSPWSPGIRNHFQKAPGEVLLTVLTQRLKRMFLPVMVMEERIYALENALSDRPAKEQEATFSRFVCQVANTYECLSRYPVLCRMLVKVIEHWCSAAAELYARMSADWSEIGVAFNLNPAAEVLTIKAGGDFHLKGRFVAVLRFTTGERLVYKPRDMELEMTIFNFVTWVSDEAALPQKFPVTIAKNGYGWQEFLGHQSCDSPDQFKDYYRRLGGLMAVGQVISAADIHYQNLIAHGPYPIMIDGEAFLKPEIFGASGQKNTLLELFPVLGSGILPKKIQRNSSEVFDSSAYAAEAGKPYADKMAALRGGGDQPHHIAEIEEVSPKVESQPFCGTEVARPRQYEQELRDGYEILYRFILRHRTSEDFRHRMQRLRGTLRYVMRPTMVYSDKLIDLMHPDICRDAFEADVLLEELWPAEAGRVYRPAPTIVCERAQMWEFDVPVFHASVDERHLRYGSAILAENYFHVSGRDTLNANLASMSEESLLRQKWMISATINAHDECSLPFSNIRRSVESVEALRFRCIEAIASRIAEHAEKTREHAVTWATYSIDDHRSMRFKHCGTDLYDGLSGIGLFFSAFRHVTKRNHYRDLENIVLGEIQKQIRENAAHSLSPFFGGFTGIGSCLYSLGLIRTEFGGMCLDIDLDLSKHLTTAVAGLGRSEEGRPRHLHDMLTGAAGGLLVLLSSGQDLSTSQKECAIIAGEYLVGLIDPRSDEGEPLLTGLSHGLAGIAHALLELYAVTGELKFKQGAARALAREDQLYDERFGNWKDLRGTHESTAGHAGEDKYAVAWCHGAVGIGLARLAMSRHQHAAPLVHEAAATTAKNLWGTNAGLCHGVFGRAAFLARYQRRFPGHLVSGQVDNMLHECLDRFSTKLSRCSGKQDYLGKNGFMNGLSGLGYELLQQTSDYSLPEALLLGRRVAW